MQKRSDVVVFKDFSAAVAARDAEQVRSRRPQTMGSAAPDPREDDYAGNVIRDQRLASRLRRDDAPDGDVTAPATGLTGALLAALIEATADATILAELSPYQPLAEQVTAKVPGYRKAIAAARDAGIEPSPLSADGGDVRRRVLSALHAARERMTVEFDGRLDVKSQTDVRDAAAEAAGIAADRR